MRNYSYDDNTSNNQGKVRVTSLDDEGCNGTSDGNFSITGTLVITAPNGSEVVVYDGSNTTEITWDLYGGITTAGLYYSTTGIAGCHSNFIENVTGPYPMR